MIIIPITLTHIIKINSTIISIKINLTIINIHINIILINIQKNSKRNIIQISTLIIFIKIKIFNHPIFTISNYLIQNLISLFKNHLMTLKINLITSMIYKIKSYPIQPTINHILMINTYLFNLQHLINLLYLTLLIDLNI